MGNATSQGLLAPEPLNRFSKKFAQLITPVTPPHVQILGSVGSKRVCLRMREVVIVRRLFFLSFFRFLADRTNGRAYATVLRLSVVVCDVMYCG